MKFDVSYEERDPIELEIEGSIPAFAAGILFRTGLGIRNIEAENGKLFRVHHWFDNLAQVHRFQIHPPSIPGEAVRVTYNSRSTCDGLIEKIRATGHRDGVTFGAKYDPCMSLFQKVRGFLIQILIFRNKKSIKHPFFMFSKITDKVI